jgi:hypothetical protein
MRTADPKSAPSAQKNLPLGIAPAAQRLATHLAARHVAARVAKEGRAVVARNPHAVLCVPTAEPLGAALARGRHASAVRKGAVDQAHGAKHHEAWQGAQAALPHEDFVLPLHGARGAARHGARPRRAADGGGRDAAAAGSGEAACHCRGRWAAEAHPQRSAWAALPRVGGRAGELTLGG